MEHQCENADSKQCNNHGSELLEGPAQPMKISDLIDDCLVKIFAYLDLQSLLNVAVANASLRPAACDVYKREYGEFSVTVCNSDNWRIRSLIESTSECPDLLESYSEIFICRAKTCLQYLRCFGPFMSRLQIDYDCSKIKCCEQVHQYINDYCAENLRSIFFDLMPEIVIEEFQKAFASIERVYVFGCKLGDQWLSFVKWFPNLRTLNIYDSTLVYHPVEKPFPFLKHLSLHYIHCDLYTTSEIAADLLDGICRLKSLRIFGTRPEMEINKILDLIKDCLSITKLELFADGIDLPVSAEEVQRLINEHPELVVFDACYKLISDHALLLTYQLKSLKKLGPVNFDSFDSGSDYENFKSQSNGKWKSDGYVWYRVEQKN